MIENTHSLGGTFGGSCQIHGELPLAASESESLPQLTDGREDASGLKSPIIKNPAYSHQYCPPEVHRSCFCVRFIAEHTKLQEDSTKVLSRDSHNCIMDLCMTFYILPNIGQRGLEVRCNGAGSTVFVDFHISCGRRNRWHYSAGAHTLRRPTANRSQMFGSCNVDQ